MGQIDCTVEYDSHGRMRYHPEYHTSHGTRMTEEELMYLCRFWEYDNRRDIAFALGRTEHTLATKVCYLRKIGKFESYKNKYNELLEV